MKDFSLILFGVLMGTFFERRAAKKLLLKNLFEGYSEKDSKENQIYRTALRKYKEDYYGK